MRAKQIVRGERRVIVNGIAIVCTVVGGNVVSWEPEMPADTASIELPLLVLTMDQGGIGSAGVFYAMGHLRLMVGTRWDKYHRGVNDVKLACQHTSGGLFRRVILLMTYLFNLNYGPFGKGAFFEDKKAMLAHFLQTQSPTSPGFRKYAPHYAAALGMPLLSDDDYEVLFGTLSDLPSFNRKGPLAKLMRWFAWWTNFDFQEHHERGGDTVRAEFWGAKMIYEHHLAGDGQSVIHTDLASILQDVDLTPNEQLRRLKAAQGGFKLAHKIMTAELYNNAKVLFRIGAPVWTEHCWRIEKIKTPSDGLTYDAELARGAWKDEVFAILAATFYSADNLKYWGLLDTSPDDSDSEHLCAHAAVLGANMACNRSWSALFE